MIAHGPRWGIDKMHYFADHGHFGFELHWNVKARVLMLTLSLGRRLVTMGHGWFDRDWEDE